MNENEPITPTLTLTPKKLGKPRKKPMLIYLRTDLSERMRHALHDPTTKRTRYGAISSLLEALIEDWLASLHTQKKDDIT